MPESAYKQLLDTSSIATQEVEEVLPTRLQLTHQGDEVIFTESVNGAPVFSLSIPDIPEIWYTQSTLSLLLEPPTLGAFSEAPSVAGETSESEVSPDLILSDIASGNVVASLSPYKHDICRYGYKMSTPQGREITNSFPLDEGRNIYGIGLFETTRGKYQWLVNEFVNGKVQDPMSLKDTTVQFKLYFTKATKAAAASEAGKFLNSFLSGNTLGTGIARKVVATFSCSKTDGGVLGVLDHKGEWFDKEEAALVASSAVAALLAYKYRVQRYQHKKIKGEFY